MKKVSSVDRVWRSGKLVFVEPGFGDMVPSTNWTCHPTWAPCLASFFSRVALGRVGHGTYFCSSVLAEHLQFRISERETVEYKHVAYIS